MLPGSIDKLPDLMLATVKAMLAAVEILEEEAVEIAKSIVDEPGHLPRELFCVAPLFAMQ
jgi:hypothetical protein